MKKVNIAIGIIFILFSGFIFMQANSFTQTLIIDTGLGPEFFPKVISCGIIILSGCLIYTSIKNKLLSNKVEEIFNSNMKKPLMGMVLVVVYTICITLIGYLVSTIVFCFIFLHLFKVKNMLTKILVSTIFSSVIYFVFSKLFLINLPQGFLI